MSIVETTTGTARDGTSARVVRTAIGLAVVLFALFAVDALLIQTDAVPSFLASRVVGTLAILGFLWLVRAPIRAIGFHSSQLVSAVFVGGVVLLLVYLVLYAAQAWSLSGDGGAPSLVFGVLNADDASRGLAFTALFIVTVGLNSFVEEGLFRGIMLPLFMRRMAFWKANLLQAALFGLWHIPVAVDGWVAGTETGAEALAQGVELFLFTGTAGLVFGYLYYRTGSLWAPWLAHSIDNLILNVFHLQVASGAFVESEISLLASLIGYPLLVLAAWAVAKRGHLTRLKPWPIETDEVRTGV